MNEKRFDGLADVYAKFRPTYSLQFLNFLQNTYEFSNNTAVADIGSGTGIFTKQLLDLDCNVQAVEPNTDMRLQAENLLKSYKNFTSINATAENTTIKNNSVDFVTVAQAFHWFDQIKFKAECNRILKPNGKVFLIWNDVGADRRNAFCDKMDKVRYKYCPNFKGTSGGFKKELDNLNLFFNSTIEIKIFSNDLKFDCDSFIGRMLSSSYSLKKEDKSYIAFVKELEKLFFQFENNGNVTLPNDTKVYIGRTN